MGLVTSDQDDMVVIRIRVDKQVVKDARVLGELSGVPWRDVVSTAAKAGIRATADRVRQSVGADFGIYNGVHTQEEEEGDE